MNSQRQGRSFKVDVIDSTGAGDAFHGAFSLALAWSELLCFASVAGALICIRLGVRCGLPDHHTMDIFLETAHA